MTCLEIVCPCGVDVISSVFDVLNQYRVTLEAIESNQAGYLYVTISKVEFSDLKQMLGTLRCNEQIYDARTVEVVPSELERRELQLLLNQISYPVILIDRNGFILQTNQAVCYVCQCLMGDLIGQPLMNWVKGFSITRWLGRDNGRPEITEVYLGGRAYRAYVEPLGDNLTLSHLPSALMSFRSDSQFIPDLDLASIRDSFAPFGLIAHDPEYIRIIEQIKEIAILPRSVLIYGEVGTGKRFCAQLLNHFRGNSVGDMTVISGPINDEALDEQLLDLAANRPEMVLVYQIENFTSEQLLRIIAQMHFVAQVVYTSLLSPEEIIDQHGEVSFYSAFGQIIRLPPLRERSEDSVQLAQAWLNEHFMSKGGQSPILNRSVQQFIKKCQWPGNINQLLQVLRDTIAHTGLRAWSTKDIRYSSQHVNSETAISGLLDKDYHQAMADFEKLLLGYYYPQFPSTRALAKKLGLSHTAVAKKLKEHKIT